MRSRSRSPQALIGLPHKTDADTASAAATAPPKLTAEEAVAKMLAFCKRAELQPLPTSSGELPGTLEALVGTILANQAELSHLRALLKQRL